jgi:hypothetical protein
MTGPAKLGYGGSGEERVAAEGSVVEYFYADGTLAQTFDLAIVPLHPLVVEYYDTAKSRWQTMSEGNYSIPVGGRVVTLGAGILIVAAGGSAPSDRNVRISYQPIPCIGEDQILEAIDPTTGTYGEIQITGVAGTGSLDLTLSPVTGKADITRIVITRIANAGTAYDAVSRTAEIFDVNIAAAPVSQSENSLFYEGTPTALTSGGNLVNRAGLEIAFVNDDTTQFGQVSVTIAAAGGAGDSDETYRIRIYGKERT